VSILLNSGASTSVLQPSGDLYHCSDFAGVQHVLDTHCQTHVRLVFDAIAHKKPLATLKTTFMVSFWTFLVISDIREFSFA